MTHKRMEESAINASLDAYLHGAREGDIGQARQLHGMLDRMLTEQDSSDGRLWLTDHGKTLLADMHHKLSLCEGEGEPFKETVIDAVGLSPSHEYEADMCSFVQDLRVAVSVANKMCEQQNAGGKPDIDLAVEAVADSGEFGLEAADVRAVYDRIATHVSGFREITHC